MDTLPNKCNTRQNALIKYRARQEASTAKTDNTRETYGERQPLDG